MLISNVINLIDNKNDWLNNNGLIHKGKGDGGEKCMGLSPTTSQNILLNIEKNNESIENNHQQTTKKKLINTLNSSGNNSGKLNFGKKKTKLL